MSMDAVVDACEGVRRARQALRDACERRDDAVREAYALTPHPQRQMADVIRQALSRAGWFEDDIAEVGVSFGNVRLILSRVRRE